MISHAQQQGLEISEIIEDTNRLKEYKMLVGGNKQKENKEELATILIRIANHYFKTNESDSAFVYYKKALEKYEIVKDSFLIAYCMHRIGGHIIYNLSNNNEGLSMVKTAADYFERNGKYSLAAHNSFDIGLYYKKINDSTSRKTYWDKARKLNKLAKDTLLDVIMLLEEARDMRDRGNNQMAIVKSGEALAKSKLINSKLFIKESLYNLGKNYLLMGKSKEAIRYLEESTELFSAHFKEELPELYRLLSIAYIRLKESSKAEKYLSLYKSSLDSIATIDKKENYAGLVVQYETEKKQATITALEQENKLKKSQAANQRVLIFSLAGVLFLLLIIGWIVANNRKKRKQVELEMAAQRISYEDALLKEKDEKMLSDFNKQLAEVQLTALNAQMNPHFIFNCMNSIQKYILKNEKSKALDFLQHFSELMRLVLDNSSKNKIGLDEELSMLEKYIQLEQQRLDFMFDYKLNVAQGLQTDFYEIPAMIIQPYVENAIWHGLMNKQGKGLLIVSFELKENFIKCIVEDNGVGRKMAGEMEQYQSPKRKSYGMSISRKRIELLKKENVLIPEVVIEDLKKENAEPTGTRVIINIPFD